MNHFNEPSVSSLFIGHLSIYHLVQYLGCYWGTEKFVVKDFQKKFPGAIKHAQVGFMSPDPNAMENPSYKQVCSGSTGHVEVLYVELNDPSETTYEELIRFFFQFHDPTTLNRQGNDSGTQYASVIFCGDSKQKKIATKVKSDLQELVTSGKVRYAGRQVVTGIFAMQPFYPAHEAHQDYLTKNPLGYWYVGPFRVFCLSVTSQLVAAASVVFFFYPQEGASHIVFYPLCSL